MASLIPCSHCLRHVRREEAQCPFCGAERTPALAVARPVLREAKRATLFALGLTLAGQACGGKEDEGNKRDGVGLIPPYGIGPAELSGGAGGNGGASGSSGEGGSQSAMSVPPYGGTFRPPPEGGSGGAEESDAGTPDDAGSADAGDAGTDPDAAG
jgi:hypothetical protein